MLLHFVLELLCSIILATDTSWHSASLNLGSAESPHSRAHGRPGGWGWQGWRSGESTRLPPMWPGFDSRSRCQMWVEFVVGSRPCSEGFSPSIKPTFPNSTSTWT